MEEAGCVADLLSPVLQTVTQSLDVLGLQDAGQEPLDLDGLLDAIDRAPDDLDSQCAHQQQLDLRG